MCAVGFGKTHLTQRMSKSFLKRRHLLLLIAVAGISIYSNIDFVFMGDLDHLLG